MCAYIHKEVGVILHNLDSWLTQSDSAWIAIYRLLWVPLVFSRKTNWKLWLWFCTLREREREKIWQKCQFFCACMYMYICGRWKSSIKSNYVTNGRKKLEDQERRRQSECMTWLLLKERFFGVLICATLHVWRDSVNNYITNLKLILQ